MDASEKIKEIVDFFLRMKREQPGWLFLTFHNIKNELGIPKKEALAICELLKQEGLIDYEFMPFDDTEKKISILDKTYDDALDETGSMSFVGFPKDGVPPRKVNAFEISRLEEIIASNKKREILARKLRPEVRYDNDTHRLISGENFEEIRSHNHRVVCETVFAKPLGEVFAESEVADLLDKVTAQGKRAKGYRAEYHQLYNVLYQINLKIKNLTGVPKFIKNKTGEIWAG